jgi:spore coat polysaccharide biosynthesis predicted glycosyltransferase SpsG/RimJ/RimL family protein N-acetyltransferase
VPEGFVTLEAEALWLAQQLHQDDLLVLDGYEFDSSYQQVISQSHFGLACIDDLMVSQVWADLIINQAGGIEPVLYRNAPAALLCLGPTFALLRAPFQLPATNRLATGRVFFSMGGADPGNQTAALLPSLAQRFPNRLIEVLTGAAYPHLATLVSIGSSCPNVRLHHNLTAEALANLLRSCDLFICPPSGLAYECCAVGGLLFLHQTADNQEALYSFLTSNNLALPFSQLAVLPDAELPTLATAVRAQQHALFDGQAGARLLKAFVELHATASLSLRKAKITDCYQYFEWANDTDVRRNAIAQAPIPWPVHEAWFNRRLADTDSYLLIAEINSQPVGQVRVEFTNEVGTIDYSVTAEARGRGHGKRLLRRAIHWLRHHRGSSWTLHAEVRTSNEASIRVFQGLRFTQAGSVERKGDVFMVYELAVNSGL